MSPVDVRRRAITLNFALLSNKHVLAASVKFWQPSEKVQALKKVPPKSRVLKIHTCPFVWWVLTYIGPTIKKGKGSVDNGFP